MNEAVLRDSYGNVVLVEPLLKGESPENALKRLLKKEIASGAWYFYVKNRLKLIHHNAGGKA